MTEENIFKINFDLKKGFLEENLQWLRDNNLKAIIDNLISNKEE